MTDPDKMLSDLSFPFTYSSFSNEMNIFCLFRLRVDYIIQVIIAKGKLSPDWPTNTVLTERERRKKK